MDYENQSINRQAKKKAKEDKKIAELAGERGQGQKERWAEVYL